MADSSQHPPAGESALPDDGPSWLVRAARTIGMDRAVGYAVMSRMWQLLIGPVTQLLIILWFTRSTQGFYQAFAYLLGMQVFVELGLHVVIINLSSHEWARLRFDGHQIQGDSLALNRLGTLYASFLRWYVAAAVLFVVLVGGAGCSYLQESTAFHASSAMAGDATRAETVHWLGPWLALVVLTGLQLPLLPATAMLEGCDQLRIINRVRFVQAVAGTVVVWLMIVSGAGLWTLAGSATVRLLGEAWLARRSFGAFFRSLPSAVSSVVDWRNEVLPLQWRIAVQGSLLWFVNGVPGLVVFRWHGEGETARLGMTWTILTALQAASMAWIETRRPQFGALIAQRRYAELDQLFFRTTRWSVGLMSLAGLTFALAVWWMGRRNEWLFVRIADRMLPAVPTLYFVCAMIILQFALCVSLYVRAHKRDPFLVASMITGVTLATLEIWWGKERGPAGVALGYLLGVACVQVPLWTLIWRQCRREWHPPEPQEIRKTGTP